MIEIKKHGRVVHTLLKWDNVICYNCKCEFSCDSNDTTNTRNVNSKSCDVYCPDCHYLIKLHFDEAAKIEHIETFGENNDK